MVPGSRWSAARACQRRRAEEDHRARIPETDGSGLASRLGGLATGNRRAAATGSAEAGASGRSAAAGTSAATRSGTTHLRERARTRGHSPGHTCATPACACRWGREGSGENRGGSGRDRCRGGSRQIAKSSSSPADRASRQARAGSTRTRAASGATGAPATHSAPGRDAGACAVCRYNAFPCAGCKQGGSCRGADDPLPGAKTNGERAGPSRRRRK